MMWREQREENNTNKDKRSMQCGIASLRHWTKKPLYVQWLAANDVNPRKKKSIVLRELAQQFFFSLHCSLPAKVCYCRYGLHSIHLDIPRLLFSSYTFTHGKWFAVFERANLFVIHRQTIPQVVVHCVQYTVGAHLLSEHSEHTATIMWLNLFNWKCASTFSFVFLFIFTLSVHVVRFVLLFLNRAHS